MTDKLTERLRPGAIEAQEMLDWLKEKGVLSHDHSKGYGSVESSEPCLACQARSKVFSLIDDCVTEQLALQREADAVQTCFYCKQGTKPYKRIVYGAGKKPLSESWFHKISVNEHSLELPCKGSAIRNSSPDPDAARQRIEREAIENKIVALKSKLSKTEPERDEWTGNSDDAYDDGYARGEYFAIRNCIKELEAE